SLDLEPEGEAATPGHRLPVFRRRLVTAGARLRALQARLIETRAPGALSDRRVARELAARIDAEGDHRGALLLEAPRGGRVVIVAGRQGLAGAGGRATRGPRRRRRVRLRLHGRVGGGGGG